MKDFIDKYLEMEKFYLNERQRSIAVEMLIEIQHLRTRLQRCEEARAKG